MQVAVAQTRLCGRTGGGRRAREKREEGRVKSVS